MKFDRRQLLGALVTIVVLGPRKIFFAQGKPAMHGLIGKVIAVSGARDALIDILVQGTTHMPGCLSYIVARDVTDKDAIWISEVGIDQASHEASLSLPAVRAAIAKARPLIAGFGDSTVTVPVGGHGLQK